MQVTKMSFIKQLTWAAFLAPFMISSVFAAYPDKPIKMMIGYAQEALQILLEELLQMTLVSP